MAKLKRPLCLMPLHRRMLLLLRVQPPRCCSCTGAASRRRSCSPKYCAASCFWTRNRSVEMNPSQRNQGLQAGLRPRWCKIQSRKRVPVSHGRKHRALLRHKKSSPFGCGMISTTAESTLGGGRNCSRPILITIRTDDERSCVFTDRRQYADEPAAGNTQHLGNTHILLD